MRLEYLLQNQATKGYNMELYHVQKARRRSHRRQKFAYILLLVILSAFLKKRIEFCV